MLIIKILSRVSVVLLCSIGYSLDLEITNTKGNTYILSNAVFCNGTTNAYGTESTHAGYFYFTIKNEYIKFDFDEIKSITIIRYLGDNIVGRLPDNWSLGHRLLVDVELKNGQIKKNIVLHRCDKINGERNGMSCVLPLCPENTGSIKKMVFM